MEWFLINKDEHLGPFSTEDVHMMYEKGELDKDSLLWKESIGDPLSYEELFILEPGQGKFVALNEKASNIPSRSDENQIIKNEDIPPDLPPEVISFKNKVESIKQVVSDQASQGLEDMTEQNQTEIEPKNDLSDIEEEIDVEKEFFKSTNVDFSEHVKRYSFITVVTVIAFMIVIMPFYFYMKSGDKVFKRPGTMSIKDYERLLIVANDESKDLKFSFALASDKRTLWLTTNVSLEGEVFINLKSKSHMSLGPVVEVKASGELAQKLITLKEFQFVQGRKFVDGYYDAEIYTVDDLEQSFFNRFFDSREKQFRYLNDVLITSMDPLVFESLLNEKLAKKNKNDQKFLEELKEEYRTIHFLTSNIKESIEKIFIEDQSSWSSKVATLEKSYGKEYGLFYTRFIERINAKYEKVEGTDFTNKTKIRNLFTNIEKIAKEVGEEFISELEKLKEVEIKKLSKKQVQDLKYNTLLKFNLIISECEKMIEEL